MKKDERLMEHPTCERRQHMKKYKPLPDVSLSDLKRLDIDLDATFNGEPIGVFDCRGYGLHASVVLLYYKGKRLEGIFFLKSRNGQFKENGSRCINWAYGDYGWDNYEYRFGGYIYKRRCRFLQKLQSNSMKEV